MVAFSVVGPRVKRRSTTATIASEAQPLEVLVAFVGILLRVLLLYMPEVIDALACGL